MKVSRLLVLAATAGILTLQTIGVAQGTTIGLSLIATSGTLQNGSGSLTVNGPVASSGFETFSSGAGLTALSFSLDGNTFSLGNDPLAAAVTFFNGSLFSILYGGETNNFQLDFVSGGLNYSYFDFLDGDGSAGRIAITPLAPAWLLMLTGLGALGLFIRRNKRSVAARTLPI